MLKVNRKIKLAAIGVVAAVSASVFVMPFTANRSQAAVAVFDEQNIAEAIKTAINTANILTETQKQLALDILNTKGFNNKILERFIKGTYNDIKDSQDSTQKVFDEGMASTDKATSIMHLDRSMTDFWADQIENVDAILSGNMTLTDLYNQYEKHRKAEEIMSKTSINVSREAVASAENVQERVNESLENSAEAEGQKEAVQANTQGIAAGVTAVETGNTIMATMLAQQAQKDAIENAEKMAAVKHEADVRNSVNNSANKIIDATRWIKWK